MPRLVALAVPGGDAFVAELGRVWDEGDAATVLDGRLPAAARDRVLDVLRPTVVVTLEGRHARAGAVPVAEGDALVVATSGTTGPPKGVVLTHEAVAASARAASARLQVDPAVDRWLACLPLAHVGGLSVVARALVTGTPLEVHPGFEARAVEAAARERGATLVSLVPAALRRLDPSRFRWVVLGGSAPPGGLPANAVATYGSTETGSGVVYDGHPLDGVDVRIGDDGVIWLRGPMLLRAYRRGEHESFPLDADGWFRTGDAGALDADGRLTVHGRLDDVIVTGGEKVWPDAVEAVLRQVPGVADVAVVGRPDPEWGERVVAVLVPSAGAELPPLEALRESVKAVLGPWCAPREVVAAASLPRTAIGKLRRGELAAH